MDNKTIITEWARELLRKEGYTVKADEPIEFYFIPDDCVGGLAIWTKTKYRREQAYVSVEDESIMDTLASLVEYARKAQ